MAKPNTRWSSTAQDGAWIQFDFGGKTQVGYMKLTWENAYGKEYALQVSDDGKTWTQLRYVSDGKGGTEEFFKPERANARLHPPAGRRARHAIWLFAVRSRVQDAGSDNTLPASATSALRYPANGSGLAPLPPANPIETLQFRCPTAPWSPASARARWRGTGASAARSGTRSATAPTRRSIRPPACPSTRDPATT